MTIIAFFNDKGGVGKTKLAYHLAHMIARLRHRVLAVDLDPQANLTSAFFDEPVLERLWDGSSGTVFSGVEPILRGLGDIATPPPIEAGEDLWILPGDLALSRFEDRLSESWTRGYDGDEAAIRVTTAFHRMSRQAATSVGADIVLIDIGPNLGAINRAALLASDWVVIPLAADLFSLQGLRNLGPTLRAWRLSWSTNTYPKVPAGVDAPRGTMQPVGYVVLQHAVRLDRPVLAYDRWLRRIPAEFHRSVLDDKDPAPGVDDDPFRLASLRNYRSLMPLAQDARKPMFDLRAADGALGSTGRLVLTCEREFRALAHAILQKIGVERPPAQPT
ncbi:MAG TPA: AAA family ATPase [Candidatus Dormibacteraeota bacterium]|jgi:cellulose biosynthesis protein BcsQ